MKPNKLNSFLFAACVAIAIVAILALLWMAHFEWVRQTYGPDAPFEDWYPRWLADIAYFINDYDHATRIPINDGSNQPEIHIFEDGSYIITWDGATIARGCIEGAICED